MQAPTNARARSRTPARIVSVNQHPTLPLFCFLAFVFSLTIAPDLHAELTVTTTDHSVEVQVDGEPFTTYHWSHPTSAKPMFYPVVGPNGVGLTRNFPMREGVAGEKGDHPHHTSLFYTHGDVNGHDFWHHKKERIEQSELVRAEVDPESGAAMIETKNRWVAGDGTVQLTDHRVHNCSVTAAGNRAIDLRVTLHASEGDVVFGDTKEGSLGVRLHPGLKLRDGATGVNSEGVTGKKVWGTSAAWVSYTGTTEDGPDAKPIGVAVLDHPDNPRHPTTWHARDYGLLAANPFGWRAFKGKKHDGTLTIPEGESVTFAYRVLLHTGADVAEEYAAWTEPATRATRATRAEPAKPVLKGLMIAGGCCHDYDRQPDILGEGINERLDDFQIDWTVIRDAKDRTTKHKAYDDSEWAEGFDVILHNECYGGVTDIGFIKRITEAHSNGVPSVAVHCSTHSYRDSNSDEWRKLIGATSRRHGPKAPVTLKSLKPEHPVMHLFPAAGWTTGKEELYYIEKMWPGTTILAEGVQGKQVHPIVWVKEYGKGRSFNTTLGHYNETMQNPIYLDMVTRGLLWSMRRLPGEGPEAALPPIPKK